MPIPLEDKEGKPWTASAGIGWLTLSAVLTLGFAAPLLGLYLSLWIRSKGRSAFPLICYAVACAAFVADLIPDRMFPAAVVADSLSAAISLVFAAAWFAGPFLLRHEIQRYYKEVEGWDIEIGPFFTFLFSALYINYCLNPLTLPEKNAPTTLHLRK
jgi:hypothetical protein